MGPLRSVCARIRLHRPGHAAGSATHSPRPGPLSTVPVRRSVARRAILRIRQCPHPNRGSETTLGQGPVPVILPQTAAPARDSTRDAQQHCPLGTFAELRGRHARRCRPSSRPLHPMKTMVWQRPSLAGRGLVTANLRTGLGARSQCRERFLLWRAGPAGRFPCATVSKQKPKDVMAGLMDSPGHGDNILRPLHCEVHIGMARHGHAVAVAQVFRGSMFGSARFPGWRKAGMPWRAKSRRRSN